jgi:molybdenum cofactor cytidylyltransferase
MASGSEPKHEIYAVLLAAGSSSRMKGRDKLLENIDNIPLLRRSAMACVNSEAARTFVILRPNDAARTETLQDLPLTLLRNPDHAEGMASSIRAALVGFPYPPSAIMVVLADMPDITSEHLSRLCRAFAPGAGITICRAVSEGGTPGHPVLFGKVHFEALKQISGDAGGRDILTAHPDAIELVPLPGRVALTDLDTPEDWAAYGR